MPYSEFTLEKVIADLGITIQDKPLFSDLSPLPEPQWLKELLKKQTQLALISEKARSEFIIGPILLACRELSQDKVAVFSGQRLDVDANRGLTGECDFILALSPAILPLRAPILTVVEAKKNDVESGLGQCIAEMVAALEFNQAVNPNDSVVYGCVTTGEVWQFLQLSQATAWLDTQRYYLNSVGKILAVLHQIFEASQN